jgi:hypothetical protein
MAITKRRIWVPPVNHFTGAATGLRRVALTSEWIGLLNGEDREQDRQEN